MSRERLARPLLGSYVVHPLYPGAMTMKEE